MADDDTADEFGTVVNMTAAELEKWLDTDESKAVGQKSGASESTGHESGRRIVKILRTASRTSATTTTPTCARSSVMPSGISLSARTATSPIRSGAIH